VSGKKGERKRSLREGDKLGKRRDGGREGVVKGERW